MSAETGLQLRRVRVEGQEALSATDDDGSAFWVIPSRELVVLNIASHGQVQEDLPALLVRALLPQ